MLLTTGLPVVVILAQFGVIVWLLLGRRDDRQRMTDLLLLARRLHLRLPPGAAREDDTAFLHDTPTTTKGAK